MATPTGLQRGKLCSQQNGRIAHGSVLVLGGTRAVRSPPLARLPLLFTAEAANTCWEAVLLAWLLPLGMENGAFSPPGLGQGTYLPGVSWGWPQSAPTWILGAEEPTPPQRCPGPEQQLVPSRGL